MVGVYVRVSSEGQRWDSQELELVRWLEGNGVSEVEWYREKVSGKTLDRPEFKRLQGDVFSGKVRTVVVWKLDRLSRRLRDGVNLLADWCDRGVRVVSVTQQLDLSGPVGRMVAAVMLGLAEIELEYRSERQRSGIEAAKRRGVYKGSVPGWRKGSVERAKKLKAKGFSSKEVARALGVSQRTVWRYLK